jgi:type II secretory pathway pseudopilin PulG
MKHLHRRLRSCRGESLVESMVSILIFTLSSVLFFTMVTSATRINQTVKESDQALQTQRLAMEGRTESTTTGTVTITTSNGSTLVDVKVVGENGVYAYYLPEAGG